MCAKRSGCERVREPAEGLRRDRTGGRHLDPHTATEYLPWEQAVAILPDSVNSLSAAQAIQVADIRGPLRKDAERVSSFATGKERNGRQVRSRGEQDRREIA
jgi:hypothetical protein